MTAHKDDAGKPGMHLLPPESLVAITRVLDHGAVTYGPNNWRKGLEWSRYHAALLRHMTAWWAGEDTDPETGLSHLAHAACCAMFLLSYEERGVGIDDRPETKDDLA